MNILHIVYNRVGQGSYWRALHFGKSLVKRGHKVTLIATSKQRRTGIKTYQLDGVELVEAPDLLQGPLRSGWDPWNTLNRLLWLRKRKFDLVFAVEARPTVIYPALYFHRIRDIPIVFDWADWLGRGGSVEERPNRLIRTILRPIETYFEEHFRTEADGTIVICTTLQQKAINLGVKPETIRLIQNGCNPDLLQPIAPKDARRQVGLNPELTYIGYVGSIFLQDAELMAKAFDQLATQYSTLRLLIVGYCPTAINKLSHHPEAIIQTGPVNDQQLYHYLASCEILWLPLSDTNANRGRWPYKLNDYMALGRPTIATAVGDVKELFEQEEIGLLSPPQPDVFAHQTLTLLLDEKLQAQMGARARHLAKTRFNWENLTGEMERLYLEALQRHTKH